MRTEGTNAARGRIDDRGSVLGGRRRAAPHREDLARRLLERSIRVGVGVHGEDKHLRFAPALNVTSEEIAKLVAALREVVQ